MCIAERANQVTASGSSLSRRFSSELGDRENEPLMYSRSKKVEEGVVPKSSDEDEFLDGERKKKTAQGQISEDMSNVNNDKNGQSIVRGRRPLRPLTRAYDNCVHIHWQVRS
ncbi:hypothetical protein PIB30_006460 [Stylosanthes scabra]|uniref:Uncharacterized protein n=1 Tax=Stylosanthes scabra TaxID=79078 RepID=A0ABU6U485_9FABA|nr:hypothetical protein [Stylosanthes scabra]